MGVARRIGRDMAYGIIPISGKLIAETTVQHVTCDDMINPDIAAQITFLSGIIRTLGKYQLHNR